MTKKETIVLVHGIWEFPVNLWFWGHHLKKAGYNIVYFQYHSVLDDISSNTEKLADFLKKIKAEKIHLVGHSLGGLIVLNYLENTPAHNIQYSVVLGSPVKGSIVARELGRMLIGRKIFGKNFNLLCNGLKLFHEHEVGVISGTSGKGLGRLFADLPKPHDGAVSVQETQFPNRHDAISLSTSHTTMLFSRRVVIKIIEFLTKGQFIHKDSSLPTSQ